MSRTPSALTQKPQLGETLTELRPLALPERYFQKSAPALAKALLGTYLVHESPDGAVAGRIVETEAYLGCEDPACHAARGITKRNAVMFGPAGVSYIYFIYGMYMCFNVVSGKSGSGEAVLVRALEPVLGLDLMRARRMLETTTQLCSGPGKLTIAMDIEREMSGRELFPREGKPFPELYLLPRNAFPELGRSLPPRTVATATRIGVSAGAELELRYYIAENPHVSKK